MTYWKRQNYEDNKKINDREREGEGMNRWNTEHFNGGENILHLDLGDLHRCIDTSKQAQLYTKICAF